MRGFLKSKDGIFELSSKITTIGREGCDLIIQALGTDRKHAIIEYNQSEQKFLLQDLNSSSGTFVNSTLVRQTVIPLAAGDCIRFGNPCAVFQFVLSGQEVVCIPLNQRRVLKKPFPRIIYQDGLPQLRSVICNDPHLPDEFYDENSSPSKPGWIMGSRPVVNVTDQEKDAMLKMNRLNSECPQVNCVQCVHKDDIIDQLRDEVANIQTKLRQKEVSHCVIRCIDPSLPNDEIKLLQLEQQLQAEKPADMRKGLLEMSEFSFTDLKDMTENYRYIASMENSRSSLRLDDLFLPEQHVLEWNQSQTKQDKQENHELERMKCEMKATMEVIAKMGNDMHNKDETICRLSKEAEMLFNDNANKEAEIDVLMDSLNRKYCGEMCREDQLIKKDREIVVLKFKLKRATFQNEEQSRKLCCLTKQLEKLMCEAETSRTIIKNLEGKIKTHEVAAEDNVRTEQTTRVAMETLVAQLERLRQPLIGVAFSKDRQKTSEQDSTTGKKSQDKSTSGSKGLDKSTSGKLAVEKKSNEQSSGADKVLEPAITDQELVDAVKACFTGGEQNQESKTKVPAPPVIIPASG